MGSFEEFLKDYEAKEIEAHERFFKKLREGKVSLRETYPPKNRFIKMKDPIAAPSPLAPIWGVIPFYGSTIIPLIPRNDRSEFDEIHNNMGFTSRDIDKMIDLVKDTGRIQFRFTSRPPYYKNLEFLEPIFTELKPPLIIPPINEIIGKKYEEYYIEFDTLANIRFKKMFLDLWHTQGVSMQYITERYRDNADHYALFKFFGLNELIEDLENLMINDPIKASRVFAVFGSMIAIPLIDPLKSIYNYSTEELIRFSELGKEYGLERETMPYDVGKFILNKLIHYPENLEGCRNIIDSYDQYNLYKVLNALNEGVKKKDIDLIEAKKDILSEILENIWEDANKLKRGTKAISQGIRWGVSVSIGLIGELAANLHGAGILITLGFKNVLDRIIGVKLASLSENIAKFFSPNHLITIYNFKKTYERKMINSK